MAAQYWLDVETGRITLTSYVNDDPTLARNYEDAMDFSELKRITCDGSCLMFNKKDYQTGSVAWIIRWVDVAWYSVAGVQSSVPTIWTVYDLLLVKIAAQQAHP